MKFGDLFNEGVLQLGDTLTVIYSSAFSAASSEGVATLTVCVIKFPNLARAPASPLDLRSPLFPFPRQSIHTSDD